MYLLFLLLNVLLILFQLLLFPEGTRFTSKKHETSLEFARKNNLPVLKHHLLPRTRGFIASLPSMKGKVPAVYDIELAFKEDAPIKPTITNMLFGKPLDAHMYMRRIPMEDLPKTEAEQETFLRDIFVRKVNIFFFQIGGSTDIKIPFPVMLMNCVTGMVNISLYHCKSKKGDQIPLLELNENNC